MARAARARARAARAGKNQQRTVHLQDSNTNDRTPEPLKLRTYNVIKVLETTRIPAQVAHSLLCLQTNRPGTTVTTV